MINLEPSIKSKIELWLNSSIDNQTKAEIQSLIDNKNENELIDSFYKDLEFGTGGLRGLMGAGTNRVNKYTVGMATQGLANYLVKSFPGEEICIALTHDCRINNTLLADTTANVFSANGIKVKYFRSLRPTPMLSFAIRYFNCKSGVMVTASHNPKEYNGYKAYWNDGAQIVAPHDKNIILEVEKITTFEEVKWEKNDSLIEYIDEDFDSIYLAEVKKLSLSPNEILLQKEMPIVFSPIHGASGLMVPAALKSFGFENIHIVKEQEVPDGNFPTVIYPNPEEAEALTMAIELGKKVNAELVMACDPDGDRYAACVPDGKGSFELLNGNQTGSIITYYLLSKWQEYGKLTGSQFMVNTIVTTELIDEICKSFNVKCYSVLTGFKNIAEVIKLKEGKEIFIGGGEESYGYLVGDFVRDKDGVSACALFAEIVAYYKSKGKTIQDVLTEVYLQHGFYKEHLISVTKKGKDGAEQIQQLMHDYRVKKPTSINGVKVTRIIDVQEGVAYDMLKNTTETLLLSKSNVMQFYLEDGSKISARPSGTEPKIKYYFSVRESLPNAESYDTVSRSLNKKIEDLQKFFA
jgi:phosphoglucomutase